MDVNQATKRRIRELCEEKRITPNALSYLCGVSQSTVKSILNDETTSPTISTIKKLCDGSEIKLAEFFHTEEFNNLEQQIR